MHLMVRQAGQRLEKGDLILWEQKFSTVRAKVRYKRAKFLVIECKMNGKIILSDFRDI